MNIPLWPNPVPGTFQPHLTPYLLSSSKAGPCIIICPGGAYQHRADHEGGPIAEKFNRLGFNAFVLHYRVHPQSHFPSPQQDALRAIKIVRSRATEFNIKPDTIALLGFSAGGHLTVSASFLYDELQANAGDVADTVSARPDASILCYAVISGLTQPNVGSFQNLLGESKPSKEKLAALSGERHVNKHTPPAFLWHTAEDSGVHVTNSINYATELQRHGIPYSLHVFPFGTHGLGLAASKPDVARWPELCVDFLHAIGF